MATRSSILAWESPWAEELGGLRSLRWQRSRARLSGRPRTSLSPGPLTFPKAAAASPEAPLGSQGGSVGSDAEPAAPHLSSVL